MYYIIESFLYCFQYFYKKYGIYFLQKSMAKRGDEPKARHRFTIFLRMFVQGMSGFCALFLKALYENVVGNPGSPTTPPENLIISKNKISFHFC